MKLNPQPTTLQQQVRVASLTATLSLTATAPLRTATPQTGGQIKGEPT